MLWAVCDYFYNRQPPSLLFVTIQRFCTTAPWSFGGSAFRTAEITPARQPTRSKTVKIVEIILNCFIIVKKVIISTDDDDAMQVGDPISKTVGLKINGEKPRKS